MSQIIRPNTPILNQNTRVEPLGWGASAAGTTVTGGIAGAGLPAIIGTTVNAWAGFKIYVAPPTGNNRVLFNFRINGGAWSPDLYARPGTDGAAGSWVKFPILLNVAAGSLIEMQCRTQNNSIPVPMAIVGTIKTANSPPLYTTMTALLTPDTANVRASTTSLPMVSSLAWTTLVASAPAAGAIMAIVGDPVTITANKKGALYLALGPNPSEVEFGLQPWLAATATPVLRTPSCEIFDTAIAATQRISGCMLTTTPDADTAPIQLIAFS